MTAPTQASNEGWEDIATAPEVARDLYEARIADLQLALRLALAWLIQHEPGDSRGVSDEFVAMASIECGLDSPADRPEECREIIRAALRKAERVQP